MADERYTMLRLGPANADADAAWLDTGVVRRVVRLDRAASDGTRLGSRVLGIGVDSAVLAVKTLLLGCRRPYLIANPWIAVAMRMTGRRDFVVTGLYADPGSRSWRLLRRTMGHALVVTTAEVEAENWNKEGGSAAAVTYGNTFGYRLLERSPSLRIFVGGSSDRDLGVVERLVEEIERYDGSVALDLCLGGLEVPDAISSSPRVEVHDRVTSARFGELMSAASVVLIPLREGDRAAGHMVAVGSLEAGTPFVASPTRGMSGYFDSPGAVRLASTIEILPQLVAVAEEFRDKRSPIRDGWARRHSREAYIQRVVRAIGNLHDPSEPPTS